MQRSDQVPGEPSNPTRERTQSARALRTSWRSLALTAEFSLDLREIRTAADRIQRGIGRQRFPDARAPLGRGHLGERAAQERDALDLVLVGEAVVSREGRVAAWLPGSLRIDARDVVEHLPVADVGHEHLPGFLDAFPVGSASSK